MVESSFRLDEETDDGRFGTPVSPDGLAVGRKGEALDHRLLRDAGWERLVLHVLEGGELRAVDDGLDEQTVASITYGDLIDPSGAWASQAEWLDDRNVVAPTGHRGRTHVYRFDLDGKIEPLTEGDVVCTSLATQGGRIAVVANVDSDPGEVYAVEEGHTLRRVTTNGSRWFGPFRRVPERIVVRHPEGHEVEAWLLRARGRKKASLVLNVHGGPYAAHNPRPWMEMLALADAGIHVVWTNPRGSVGHPTCGRFSGRP